MRNLTATICLIFAIFFGSMGMSWGAEFQAGLRAYDSLDYATALREWKSLAKHGDAAAQFNLGQMYRKGQGTSQNDETAVKWYRLSAKQEYANAQINLGNAYGRGQGVIQDIVYAHMWLNIAASSGDKGAIKTRNIIAKRMNPSQLEAAQNLSRSCIRKKYKGC